MNEAQEHVAPWALLLSAVPGRKGGPGPKEHTQLCLDSCLLCDVVGCVYRPFSEEGCRGFCQVPDGICDSEESVGAVVDTFKPSVWTHCLQCSPEWKACLGREGTLHPRRGADRAQTPHWVQTRRLVGLPGSQARSLGWPPLCPEALSRVPMRQPTQAPQWLSHSVPFPEPPSPFTDC